MGSFSIYRDFNVKVTVKIPAQGRTWLRIS